MIKVPIALVSFLVLIGLWYVKQASAKRRLAEIDAGTRCMACDGTDLEHRQGWVRCARCGHTASLESLRSVKVSDAEISRVTTPDDRRFN